MFYLWSDQSESMAVLMVLSLWFVPDFFFLILVVNF